MSRSSYYKVRKGRKADTAAENAVIKVFHENRSVYGTRKIKKELIKIGLCVSRRKIGKIMKKYNLVSKYTLKNKPKTQKTPVNEENIANVVDRNFHNRSVLEVVVSDLTYVKVAGRWAYVCLLFDVSCRRISTLLPLLSPKTHSLSGKPSTPLTVTYDSLTFSIPTAAASSTTKSLMIFSALSASRVPSLPKVRP